MKVTWIVQSNLGSMDDAECIFQACSKLNMTFVGPKVSGEKVMWTSCALSTMWRK